MPWFVLKQEVRYTQEPALQRDDSSKGFDGISNQK